MIELKAQLRTITGSKVKSLRKKGFLPGVMYGEGVESQPIATAFIEFERTLKQAGESTLITIDVEGKKYNTLIHDVSYDALTGKPIHADFYAVRMDKRITATVAIEFLGESSAVKNDGGILVKVLHEIEVDALPQDLPHGFRVDLAALSELGSKIFIKDIVVAKGVTVHGDGGEIVALVETPRSTEELEALTQAPVIGEVATVKTEQEEKREAKEKETVKEEQ